MRRAVSKVGVTTMTLRNLISSTPEGRRALAAERLRGDVLEALHDALQASGLTRKTLADRMRVSQAAVTNTLTGNGNVRVDTIARYLDAMDMDLDITLRPRHHVKNG